MDFSKLLRQGQESKFRLPDAAWPSCISACVGKQNCDEVGKCYIDCITKEATMEMLTGLLLHRHLAELVEREVEGCVAEVPVYYGVDGVPVRGRADIVCFGDKITVYEVKTTSNEVLAPFESHLIQLAMYVKYFAAVYGSATGAIVYIAKRGPPRAQVFEYAFDRLSPYYDKAREVLRCISPLFPRYVHALSL